jgi:hypothetical protein
MIVPPSFLLLTIEGWRLFHEALQELHKKRWKNKPNPHLARDMDSAEIPGTFCAELARYIRLSELRPPETKKGTAARNRSLPCRRRRRDSHPGDAGAAVSA